MQINLKVKTLDARTHEFNVDNEITIRQLKDQIAEKTSIAAENQRIIYQGRVLADDKQVKEYDVAGKVLHVAERPPFSQRGTNARHNDEPMRPVRSVARPSPGSMRTSPYFRALDAMLVGTMSIPVPNGTGAGTRTPPGRFPNSSSFCINRITVALHMIDCANNIAAYLENPSVGLNNQSLDILQRGRWSMESTVVEVGVSSTDMPRNNNIIDMVQDAVTAALTRTGARNYTVLQLPTVYTNESGETIEQRAGEPALAGAAGGAAPDTNGETTAATVIIEDVIDSEDEDGADGGSDRSATPTPDGEAEGAVGGQTAAPAAAAAPDASNAEAASGAAAGGDGAAANGGPSGATRRRTRPQVLGHVIQSYRGVQTRLAPFVDRYYDILQVDPTFGENDTADRENAQRIFDRVSEAFHYLSHAQHAISDLMLDLSQPAPRVLTCRPILVEQSGYIRSNNIFTPHFAQLEVMQQDSNTNNDQRAPGARPPGLARTVEEATRNTLGAAAQILANAGANYASALARGSARPTAPAAENAAAADTPAAAATNANANPAALAAALAQGAAQTAVLASVEAAQAAQAAASAVQMAVGAVAAIGIPTEGGPVEDPIDEPMVAPNAAPQGATQPQPQAQTMGMDEDPEQTEGPRVPPRLRLYMPVALPAPNPQLEMARLIQAVVNRASNDNNDVQVEFSEPNIMSINLPVHMVATAARPPAPGPESAPEASAESAPAGEEQASNNSGATASTSTGTRSGEQRANTLPTTATQTRSTARPQIQIGGNNNWGGRIAPTHTAFDRFLPCNSHHIREPEPLPQNNNNNSSNNNHRRTNAATAGAAGTSSATAAGGAAPSATATAAATAGAATDGITEMMNFFTTPANRTTPPVNTGVAAAAASAPAPASSSASAPNAAATTVTPSPFGDRSSNLRSELSSFLNSSVFDGAPISQETIPAAISRALDWFNGSLIYLPQYELPEYNSRESVINILRQSLRLIMELCISAPSTVAQFEQNLKKICEQFRVRLFSVLLLCLGSDNAEIYWHQMMTILRTPMQTTFQNQGWWVYVDPRIPTQTDTADAQQFLVLRSTQPDLSAAGVEPFVAPPSRAFNLQQQQPQPQTQTLDTDVEMTEVAGSSSTTNSAPAAETTPLPPVVVGSESWHMSFPSDWLPAITRDLQTQAQQTEPQPPYSDAYISGMSAKRRKIIQSETPTASVECLIASGVQRAIQSAGLGVSANGTAASSAVNVDAVIDTMTHDAAIQASYTDAMRSNVRERVKQDVDYTPNKYPQIAKFSEQK
ncbi:large proline-rich protein BAG6 isoform X1 [Drosophila guanche]|uniref:Large proline-rich protein BAG6 n=1 Tax=Drosophila guanche TaxID=7266 RepID=A0A3B0J9X3_DROGU|nr:large proline-rich protein BAG6 isoform X1 [Drosophila guanche]XP_034120892.1 large proline-rich protein BAG6 isoform X1 [Drosophila guanche]SPP77203.1 blast:Large proline-rich protein bag6-A [Drosophila guanche]